MAYNEALLLSGAAHEANRQNGASHQPKPASQEAEHGQRIVGSTASAETSTTGGGLSSRIWEPTPVPVSARGRRPCAGPSLLEPPAQGTQEEALLTAGSLSSTRSTPRSSARRHHVPLYADAYCRRRLLQRALANEGLERQEASAVFTHMTVKNAAMEGKAEGKSAASGDEEHARLTSVASAMRERLYTSGAAPPPSEWQAPVRLLTESVASTFGFDWAAYKEGLADDGTPTALAPHGVGDADGPLAGPCLAADADVDEAGCNGGAGGGEPTCAVADTEQSGGDGGLLDEGRRGPTNLQPGTKARRPSTVVPLRRVDGR